MQHGRCLSLIITLLSLVPLYCHAGLGNNPEGVMWTYEGVNGPEHWSELSKQYFLCRRGKQQSPININSHKTKSNKHKVEFHYHKAPIKIINTAYTLKLIYEHHHPEEYLVYDGQRYDLDNIHIHQPSEHMLDGRGFPLEIHFVHKNEKTNQYLALAVFIKKGPTNTFLRKEFASAPKQSEKIRVNKHFQLNPAKLLPKSTSHYSFIGSFTTPPCTEGVRWVVMRTPGYASQDQINFYQKNISTYNNRPIQPVNHRRIDVSQWLRDLYVSYQAVKLVLNI